VKLILFNFLSRFSARRLMKLKSLSLQEAKEARPGLENN
jgi:hypothetical protein